MKVSVILSVYNCENYVSKAIESILNQSYSNLELLILNDGSTDGSDSIIKKYTDERIKYIPFSENTKKIGIVNHALSVASGELIAFQDADDWSDSTRIEKQVNVFSDNELILCFTGYSINGNGKNISKYRNSDSLLRQEFHDLGFLNPGDYNPTVCATMMFRKEVLVKEKGYHPWFTGKVGEDMHLVYRIMKHGKAITIGENLYHYNYNRAGSFTHQLNIDFKPSLLISVDILAAVIELDLKQSIDILSQTKEQIIHFELDVYKKSYARMCRKAEEIKWNYERSLNYRLGKSFMYPFKFLKNVFTN